MSDGIVELSVASLVYGASTLFPIKLRTDMVVPPAAALAPSAAVATVALLPGRGASVIAVPLLCLLAAQLASRRPIGEIASHVTLVSLSIVLALSAVGSTPGSLMRRLLVSVASTCTYALAESGRVWLIGRAPRRPDVIGTQDRMVWTVLIGTLMSAAGLLVVVEQSLGWPVYPAMAAILFVARREFVAFSRAREAHAQTLEALSRLDVFSRALNR